MRKHLLPVFFVFSTLIIPHATHAQMPAASTEVLSAQLAAISDYISRMFIKPYTIPLSDEELRDVVRAGSNWFSEVQEEDGHFRYEYAPYQDALLEDDNIVRQAGALYALGEIARRDTDSSIDNQDTIKQAIAHFESLSREDTYDGTTFRCIVVNRVSSTCQLGATSLALAGILGYLGAHPEAVPEHRDLVEDYASFILAMKMPGEGFRQQYRIGRNDQTKDESPYFNGESLMTLARYYAFEPKEEVRTVILDTFAHLKERPFDGALYLWIMAALTDMQALWPNPEYVAYAEAFTDWRIGSVRPFRGTSRNYCAFSEGLASAYGVLKDHVNEEERTELLRELDYWLAKDRALQIDSGDIHRVIIDGDTLALGKLTEPQLALGGFLTAEDAPTLRIDFTQHCLGAYMQTLVDIRDKNL